jgi:hypothetical protein
MGMYLDPKDMTKESWLFENCVSFQPKAPTEMPPSDQRWVCLVNNNFFTAAAVAYNQMELERFSNPEDERPKIWFLVATERLKTLLPPFEHSYFE